MCSATLHGLKDDLAKSITTEGENHMAEKSLTVKDRRENMKKLWGNVSEDNDIPTNFLMHVPDEFFLAGLPLWEKLHGYRKTAGDDIVAPMLDAVSKHPVDELIFNGLPVKQKECEQLCNYLADQNSKSLQKLTVANSCIDEESLKTLLSSLRSQTQLSHLDLSRNKVANVIDIMGKNLHLEKLDTLVLQDAGMTKLSMNQLGELLPRCSSLRTLDLRMNGCSDDETIVSIYDGLTHCNKLKRLLISLYRVTESGLEYIRKKSSQIPFNTLKELHLIHSPIPDKLLLCVAGFLSSMMNIEELWLSASLPSQEKTPKYISYNTASNFSNALKNCQSLKVVSVQFVKCDAQSFIDLLDKCKLANTLQKLW